MANRPLFRAYLALTLDGFVARRDGGIDWLEPYDANNYGYDEFLAGIGTVVMGRETYDIVRRHPDWPYAGKRSIVVTRRALHGLPRETETRPPDFTALVAELRQASDGDVWLLGGGQLIAGFRAAGGLDRLELGYIPILLGDGIPLFPGVADQRHLKLLEHRAWPDSTLLLTYEVLPA